MKNILYIIIILVLSGCGNEKEPPPEETMTLPEKFTLAVSAGVVSVDFPDWLLAMTSEFETWKEVSWRKIFIFKGEWNKRTVYFIFHTWVSCSFCDVYYEDGSGERIIWAEDASVNDFKRTSKNWQLIYELGMGEYNFVILS